MPNEDRPSGQPVKHAATIGLAAFGVLLLLLVFQQGASISSLRLEVSMLRGQMGRLQSDFSAIRTETKRLTSLEELDRSMINTVYDGELKKSLAYCRMFPQAKNCRELLTMFSGQNAAK